MLSWWWSQVHLLSQFFPKQSKLNWGSYWFKTLLKIGSKLKEGGCIWNPSLLQKISKKKCKQKKQNLILWTSIGKWQWSSSPKRKICGIILKDNVIRQSSKIATDYLTKFKKVYPNIWKQKESTSLDSSSFQMKNCSKSWLKPKFHKPFKGTSINALRGSAS